MTLLQLILFPVKFYFFFQFSIYDLFVIIIFFGIVIVIIKKVLSQTAFLPSKSLPLIALMHSFNWHHVAPLQAQTKHSHSSY